MGSLAVILGACLFGALGVLSRTSYDLGLTPYGFVTWRSGVAAIAMAAVVAVMVLRGGRLVGWRSLAPRDRLALGVAALAGASLDVTMFLAFARVPVAVVLLCFYLFPALVAGASAMLGWERLDRTRTAALVLSLAGMVAVVVGGQGAGALEGLDPVGVLLAIGSAVSQAVFVLVARRGYREVPTEQAMTVVLAVSATIATLLALAGGALDAVVLPFSNRTCSCSCCSPASSLPAFRASCSSPAFAGSAASGRDPDARPGAGRRRAGGRVPRRSVGPVQVLGGAAILAGALIIQRSCARRELARSRDRPRLRDIERRRLAALVEADIELARALHAADYELITPGGRSLSRDDYLGGIGSGELHYLVFEAASEIRVRLHGSVAVLRYRARIEMEMADGIDSDHFWHTDMSAPGRPMAGSLVAGDGSRRADPSAAASATWRTRRRGSRG